MASSVFSPRYRLTITILLFLLATCSVHEARAQWQPLLDPKGATFTFLLTYDGTAADLVPASEDARQRAFRPGATPDTKLEYAAVLIKRITLSMERPYEEVEDLFLAASDMAPNYAGVEHLWGTFLHQAGNFEAAIPHFEKVLTQEPDHQDSLAMLGLCHMKMMQFEQALPFFERVLPAMPKNFFLLYSMGKCHFELKDYQAAIEFWEKALALAPDDQSKEAIQSLIRRAKEQEASIDGSTKDENQRFIIHYAGNSQEDIGEVTMDMLEEIYDQVTGDLMYRPDIKINVIFFRTEEFYKINNAASWVGALAQGAKILVPLQQGYANVESIRGILAHEFTHTIVNLRTNSRCPVWINEGLAVYEEFQSMYGTGEQLRPDYERVFQTHIVDQRTFLPLNQINLNPQTQTHGLMISLGYLTSYLSMRFLIERWGWAGVDSLLTKLGEGSYLDEAMEEASGKTVADFEQNFQEWMKGL